MLLLLLLRLQRQRSTRGWPLQAPAPFEGWRRTSKGVLFRRIEPGASPQPVFDFLRLPFTKGTPWVCGGVEEIGVGFQQLSVTGSKALIGELLMALQFLDQENPLYTSSVHEFAGGGSVSVQRMRDLADGTRGVAGGCSDCVGLGVCELVNRDSFVLRA